MLGLAFSLRSVVALASLVLVCGEAQAGQCLKDTRDIRLDKGTVSRLADYFCRSDSNPQVAVRVQFQRLDELTAGALLHGGAAPWLDTLYGKRRIVSNEVLKEYKTLIERFGGPLRWTDMSMISLTVTTPEQKAKDENTFVEAKKGAQLRSFKLPDFPDMPLIDETLHILNEQTWPASLNMYYASHRIDGPVFDEVTVWRYLSSEDLKQYSSRLQRYNSLIADRRSGSLRSSPKSVAMLEYLTAAGWPETFLISSAGIWDKEGCTQVDFTTKPYKLHVDIAVIENTASKPLLIDQLLGESKGGNQLRPVKLGRSRGSSDGALQFGSLTLEPAEKVTVPLALIFVAEGDTEEDRKGSDARYAKIMASRPATVLKAEPYSRLRGKTPSKTEQGAYVVRKVRESFRPPVFPVISDYAFGPEWAVSGMAIAGEKTLFEAGVPNFITLTAGHGEGSCPILYAWDGTERTWFRHGKVIHKARSRAEEMSETIEFDGFVGRFKMVEEELERAQLNAVRLTIDLEDGASRDLVPDVAALAARDSDYVGLYAGDDIEIRFTLPDGLVPADVLRSKLTVTGYYERYSQLLAAWLLQPWRIIPKDNGQ